MRSHPTGRIRSALLLPLIAAVVLLAGCGGDDTTTAGAPGVSGSPTASSSAEPAAACPSENTRTFAKTRFVADLGGAAFLTKRYIYSPYREGSFQKGAKGRTVAVVKAGVAAATSVKLLKNARDNAQANPTLCRTLAAPLSAAIASLGGVTAALASGDLTSLGSLGAALDSLRGLASQQGVDVPEQETGLNGG